MMEYIQLTKENIEKEHISCAISSNKDPQYLAHRGFQLAETAAPFYELLYLPFTSQAEVPK